MTEDFENRYAAKLLFQFRTEKNGLSNKRRVCEERIVVINAKTANEAFQLAKDRGSSGEFSYSDKGSLIFFEFIGIVDLIELGVSLEQDEVWWKFSEKVLPMERSNKLIPSKDNLSVFCNNVDSKKRKKRVP